MLGLGNGTFAGSPSLMTTMGYGIAAGEVSADTSDVFALASGGSFAWPTGVTELRPLEVSLVRANGTVEVAGYTGGAWDTSQRFDRDLATEELAIRGYVGNTYQVWQTQCSATVNTIDVQTRRFRLVKTWPLAKVSGKRSGAFDDQEKWDWDLPVISLEYDGWPRNDGPVLRSDDLTVSFDLDSLGTISFDNTLAVDRLSLATDHANGGRGFFRLSGRHQGAVSYTPGDNDLSWFFLDAASEADDPIRGGFTWNTTCESLTGTGILYQLVLDFVPVDGGYLAFDARLRGDDA